MNVARSSIKVLVLVSMLASLCLMLALPSPAIAQGSPSASQYEPGTCPAPCTAQTQSVDDSVQGLVDNAKQGTDAVNGAMDDAVEAPAASVSASPEAVLSAETGTGSSPDSPSSPDVGTADGETSEGGTGEGGTGEDGGEGEGPDATTILPETGGASPVFLGVGVLLVATGLLTRRVIGG